MEKKERDVAELKEYAEKINNVLETVFKTLERDYIGEWHMEYREKSYHAGELSEHATIGRDTPKEVLTPVSSIFPGKELTLILTRNTRDQIGKAVWKISSGWPSDDLKKIIKDALKSQGLELEDNKILSVEPEKLLPR
ncbi:hypothetical protein KAR26_03115 [Candidatus Parcubacteria bacterium]|nr:hypothetical protein [Candidatus Parcubacteria bacterium]